ncbi:hypothetical protein TNCV_3848501 [Trichonephila clavipes]|uniref:Uncharacterized protein n=1 Tax=Trichonephila clavipes TaxID=2585209 RepID=A0A8X6R8U6_TRICX|nr:hypothetical protein TNCV_3848501 [Trichonephila clavipes]
MPSSVYATFSPEVHEQMFRSGGQSDVKNPSVKFPIKLAKEEAKESDIPVLPPSVLELRRVAHHVQTFQLPRGSNANLVAQQPMRARAYCAHPSIRDYWALSRGPVKSPIKLGIHLSTHCSRDERLSRP